MMKYPMPKVKTICPRPVVRAGNPTFFKSLKSNSKPTKKRSSATPIGASPSINSTPPISGLDKKPTANPAKMKPMIGGWRNRWATNPNTAAKTKAIVISVNNGI